jgi:hypothetical protein
MRPALDPISARDTRVRIYSYSDAGTNGVVASTYTFVREVWGRFAPMSANERSVAEAASHERRATFGFQDGIPLDEHMLLVAHGDAYKVHGIPHPGTYAPGMEREVEAIWVDKASITLVEA